MYAIAIEIDVKRLNGKSEKLAFLDIRQALEKHQFSWQQGGVYFGSPAVTAATVMLAVIDLTTRLPWFAAAVRDIRMLRIEELNDFMPVVQRIAGMAEEGA